MLHGSRRRILGGLLILSVVGILMLIAFRDAPLPAVVVLPANTSLAPKVAFDKWVPMSWAWYWRAKDFILGHSKTLVIDATFVTVSPKPELPVSFPQPVKSITNLHIYFIRTNAPDIMSMITGEQGIHWKIYMTSCRIATAHGVQARLVSAGALPTNPAFSLDVLARRRRSCTDLLTSIQATGFGISDNVSVTNLAMAAQIQVPKDHAVLILKSAERPEDIVTFGVILTPTWK